MNAALGCYWKPQIVAYVFFTFSWQLPSLFILLEGPWKVVRKCFTSFLLEGRARQPTWTRIQPIAKLKLTVMTVNPERHQAQDLNHSN